MRLYLIASTPYGFIHHRFQKLADLFCGMGLSVTYIEPTHGWRAYLSGRKKDLVRTLLHSIAYHLLALLALAFRSLREKPLQQHKTITSPGLTILELPLVIPTQRLDSPVVEKLNASIFRQALRRRVFRNRGATETSVAIVDNPLWGLALDHGDFSSIFYDCIDHISLYAGRCSLDRFQRYEKFLIDKCDGVFVTAEKLEEHVKSLTSTVPVYRIPNGVDAEWFQAQAKNLPLPEDLTSVRRPIVGYVGTLYGWLDYTLITRVASTLPDVSFVFVGPLDYQSRLRQLCTAPNILWLGEKPYQDVPRYINAFDVCWIPFLHGNIREHTNPIKLFEFFALGKPVVTTPMPELEEYSAAGLSYTGNDEESMISGLRLAINERNDEIGLKRREVAKQHSWNALVLKMKSIVTKEHA